MKKINETTFPDNGNRIFFYHKQTNVSDSLQVHGHDCQKNK